MLGFYLHVWHLHQVPLCLQVQSYLCFTYLLQHHASSSPLIKLFRSVEESSLPRVITTGSALLRGYLNHQSWVIISIIIIIIIISSSSIITGTQWATTLALYPAHPVAPAATQTDLLALYCVPHPSLVLVLNQGASPISVWDSAGGLETLITTLLHR